MSGSPRRARVAEETLLPRGAPTAKLCGLRNADDARAAVAAGADMVGMVLAPSRRRVTIDEARAIVDATLDAEQGSHRVVTVGVFVDEPAEVIEAVARSVGVDLVQLAGSTADVPGLACLRVVHLPPADAGTTEANDLAASLATAPYAVGFVLDTALDGTAGGTGRRFDWHHAAAALADPAAARELDGRPVLVAGGLRDDNVAAALAAFAAAGLDVGVDVSGGIESDGAKDPARMRAFVTAARVAHPRVATPTQHPDMLPRPEEGLPS